MQSLEKTEKNLLFVHQGALGDFIVTFPVLRCLGRDYGRIDGICRTGFGHLAKHLAIIDGFYPQEAARFATLFSADIDSRVSDLLRAYECVLLFSFSETLENAVRRVKADAVHRIPPWPRDEESTHVTEFLFHRLKAKNVLPKTATTTCHEAGKPQDPSYYRRIPVPGARIIISPGAGSDSKRWPLAGYLQLAEWLTESGFYPQWVFGPAERDLEAALSVRPTPAGPIHRPRSLVQLAELLQSVDGYVGNDSAVSHLAAFVGLPAVVLFGPSDPQRWRPIGPLVTVLQAGALSEINAREVKPGCTDPGWLEQIPPVMVLEAIQRLMHP
jgi:ADP-heptose:LPS heptosyltransferase